MKGIVFNHSEKLFKCIQREIPKIQEGYSLIKVKGFCINRADILETLG